MSKCPDCGCGDYPDCTVYILDDDNEEIRDSCDNCVDGVSGAHFILDEDGYSSRGNPNGETPKGAGDPLKIAFRDAVDFLIFQREYLDNAFYNFLFAEGFLKTLEQYVAKDTGIFTRAEEESTDQEPKTPDVR